MTINIILTGIYTPPAPETRNIINLDVEYNNTIYKWQCYIPNDVNLNDYIVSITNSIKAEIDAKEILWANSSKTRIIDDPISGEPITIDISKDEIVCPDIPDYYAKRRAEYPTIGDQLGAIAKGVDSPEYLAILAKIEQVKLKYPKPQY